MEALASLASLTLTLQQYMQCNVKVYHVVQTETFGEHQREQRELPMSNKCANHVSNNQTLIQHDSTVNILLQPRY